MELAAILVVVGLGREQRSLSTSVLKGVLGKVWNLRTGERVIPLPSLETWYRAYPPGTLSQICATLGIVAC